MYIKKTNYYYEIYIEKKQLFQFTIYNVLIINISKKSILFIFF